MCPAALSSPSRTRRLTLVRNRAEGGLRWSPRFSSATSATDALLRERTASRARDLPPFPFAGEINYINAHATSTLVGDVAEVNAIKKARQRRVAVVSRLLGLPPPLCARMACSPVPSQAHAEVSPSPSVCLQAFKDGTTHVKMNGTKSMIGHGLGAAGGLEAIAVLGAIRTGWLHPTLNQDDLEEVVTIDTCPNQKVKHEVTAAISNSFGFGGHNSCVIFAPYKA